MISPCLKCNDRGIKYSEDSCKDCEFNIVIKILKEIVKDLDGCCVCKYGEIIKGGYLNCDKEDECGKFNMFEINYDKVIKEYNIKF